MSRVSVRVPTPLRDFVEGRDEVEVAGGTVAESLETLVERYPRLRRHLLEEGGEVREYVNLYVNEEDVRHLGGLSAPLSEGDVLTIVPSIAGGVEAEGDRRVSV
ncbi:MAG TPA: ubiquitin-like small modifier protein 1 [Longimicrobiales bacterium]|nr:ubiquitin-like small modifier protein 1 [Longimicrobiales bacterium]